ncbi:MAG: FAD-dependent oxidoreductase [Rhodobacteraceae bacterium]|nr:FAD-dependent oxidoreductase [Paracoccaceae bacterium]
MSRFDTDICVIGGGSGGLSVAAGAVQMGARVVLIEGHKMGGDCLNYGCVPSKALLSAAKAAKAAGPVEAEAARARYRSAQAQVRAAIAAIAPHDSVERFAGLGVDVIQDHARFIAPDTVQAGGRSIRARRFVIATGSSAAIPPIPGLDKVPCLTNETLFDLPELPGHLLILGGGPVGLEMALAHRRLGAQVTVIEGARALGRDDPEAAAVVLTALRAEGIEIVEGATVESVSGRAGAIELQVAGGTVFHGTHLLVAAGRRPNLERLDLKAGNVAFDGGGVRVGDDLRSTTNRRVHAIGDAAGRGQFTHLAGYHAGVIIRSMLFGLPARVRADHIPHVTYTDPELAQVGPTEAAARRRFGARLQVLRVEMAQIDRAQAEGRTDGFLKLMVVGGRPVGATIVGAQAGELIAPLCVAISARMKLSALAGTVLPYPTLAEIGKRGAGAYFSPKLFDNPFVKRVVRLVQRVLP